MIVKQFPWVLILCRFKGGLGDTNIEQDIRQLLAADSGGLVEYWDNISLS